MKISDLSQKDLAQLAVAMREATPPSKGRYTELVESIDKRLAKIERLVEALAADRTKPQTMHLTADDLHALTR